MQLKKIINDFAFIIIILAFATFPLFIFAYILSMRYLEFFSAITCFTLLPLFMIFGEIESLCEKHSMLSKFKNPMRILAIFSILIIIVFYALPYYKDIPYAITKNY